MQNQKPGERYVARITHTTECRCGGRVDVDTDSQAIFHSMPHCDPFVALEPARYLRWVRTGRVDGELGDGAL